MIPKLELINEQQSPLFRIMWVYNRDDPKRRHFANNICAFHIGNGWIMSVAHNLRSESGIVHTFDEKTFDSEILPRINDQHLLLQMYPHVPGTTKRHIHPGTDIKLVTNTLKQINFDTRWISLYSKNLCKPFLIVQFGNDRYYNDAELTGLFSPFMHFHEKSLGRNTYLIELELTEAFYSNDIALYRIINTDPRILSRLPYLLPDFNIYDAADEYYCLQSAPVGNLGRLLNNATIDGYLDHHAVFPDRFEGNYVVEGLRYLIKGYFRFGSSGAPYIYYDKSEKKFRINAIQSEASPVQLSINNNRDGNFQYVNAIASPLKNIQEPLSNYLSA